MDDSSTTAPVFWSAWASHSEAGAAAVRASEQLVRHFAGRSVDLAFVFISSQLVPAAEVALSAIRDRLRPRELIGVSAAAAVCNALEFEGEPAITILAAHLPGCQIHTFTDRDLPPVPESPVDLSEMRRAVFPRGDESLSVLFVDPFSVPLHRLLPAINAAKPGKDTTIVGGMASGGASPGQCVVLTSTEVRRHGMVGVSISGNLRADALVSQGCRPLGQPMVITKAKGNVILELGGRPALQAVQDMIDTFSEVDRKAIAGGLMIGRAVSEYRDRFGRGDFLIRKVLGVEPNTNALAISDLVKVGQTVQLHICDPKTADDDLAMLLDVQRLNDPPAGVLLVTCSGRGRAFFGRPNADAGRISRAFTPSQAAEQLAKGGVEIDPQSATVPLAGFLAAGEIGPMAGQSHIHAQTVCAMLFRARDN